MHPQWGGQPNFGNARILGAYGPPTHSSVILSFLVRSLSKHYSITGAKKADSVADNFVAQGTFVFLLSTMIKLQMFSFGNNK